MNPIRTNKPVFFGDNGEVLKSGNIYIGQPNQWPLSFPKTVTLQDSAGSQFTASQPLRTNGDGRITYSGKAMIALVDGDYSMLVRDRNGVTVGDGYTPFIESSTDEAGLSGVTQVGTLLSDIKQFNVTPGDTVRNVGKDTALDGLGADWLVVSNTGDPADDVDLIDFANGTQGRRIDNKVYRKDLDPTVIAPSIKDGSFDPEGMAPSVEDGSFDPADPTEVWAGTPNNIVNISELSDDSPGFYLINTVDGEALIYLSSSSTNTMGMLAFDNVFPEVIQSFVEYEADNTRFYGKSYARDGDGNVTISNINITSIKKV